MMLFIETLINRLLYAAQRAIVALQRKLSCKVLMIVWLATLTEFGIWKTKMRAWVSR